MRTIALVHVALSVCVSLSAVCACKSHEVYVMSPHQRYDHNRTRSVVIALPDEGTANLPSASDTASSGSAPRTIKVRFRTADYAPESRHPFAIGYSSSAGEPLAIAQLVPVFTGLALPLSKAPIDGCSRCQSDRDDLVDYLATGPSAQAGIEPTGTAGDVSCTKKTYGPVLDSLARPELLSEATQQLKKDLEKVADITWADRVLDARYVPGAIREVIAFSFHDFWFVLYKFPTSQAFSRLVVVPGEPNVSRTEKRPGCS